MEEKKFQRTIENFTCEHCGQKVQGSGYTNHCPKCLWSKHVDVNPGDRLSNCQGMMKPIDAYFTKDKWRIVQECEKCNHSFEVFADKKDDLNKILQLSTLEVGGGKNG